MLGESHDLFHEFPEFKNRIAELKAADPHFSQLYDEYHTVNDEVERIELQIETPSDFYTETLKKNRLHLKDEIYAILRAKLRAEALV
ncbi:MAG TPA: YdcH family protein [Candidatus Competibacteraceae bacterium]|nr:YdcH family protein [Candidatus Competibacteraceae bacterium]MCP5132731.1 YdcH family protein [Gammaproteobacteria bacterium]HPF58751.1 YdcH family protein [Candidatus Competibacteraceae bacterium]HRY19303.1 YdcH family protein [Candidatus Competibacteraceae bacterium]